MEPETYMKLCVIELDFLEKIFCPPNWERLPKTGFFFNLLKHLVINFYWICSIMKIYSIAVFLHRFHIGKLFFLRYGLKCFQPIRLQDFFHQPYLQNKSVK